MTEMEWSPPQSIKGERGPQGPQGLKGDKGDKGDTGAQGLQGLQGPLGPKGDTGDRGPQGVQGLEGARGLQGVQGVQGLKGDTGAKGDTGVGVPATGLSVVATNMSDVPGSETQTGANSNNGAVYPIVRDNTGGLARSGSWYMRSTKTPGGAANGAVLSTFAVGQAGGARQPCAAGDIINFATHVQPGPGGATKRARAGMLFYNAGGAAIGVATWGPWVAAPSGVYTRAISAPTVAPAGATQFFTTCEVVTVDGSNVADNEWCLLDDTTIWKGRLPLAHFDGDSPMARWTGLAGRSASELLDLRAADVADLVDPNRFPIVGAGLPEGIVYGMPGQEYVDTSDNIGAHRWRKSGAAPGLTGWRCVEGDTGWRTLVAWDATGAITSGAFSAGGAWGPAPASAGYVKITRRDGTVWCQMLWPTCLIANSGLSMVDVPLGFRGRGITPVVFQPFGVALNMVGLSVSGGTIARNQGNTVQGDSFGRFCSLTFGWPTDDPWPIALPGIAG